MTFFKSLVILPIIALFFLGVGAAFAQGGSDLQLTKTVDNPSPLEGEEITYTLTVRNDGAEPASAVTITDDLPEGVSYSSHGDPTHGSVIAPTAEAPTLTWILGDLAGDATAVLQVIATVDEGTYGQTITNTAQVSGLDESDSVAINVPMVDLEVAKTVDIAGPAEGQSVIYSIVVTNHGPNDATGVQLTDTLTTGVTFSSLGTPSQGTADGTDSIVWEVGDLANGASASLNVTVSVDAETSGEVITNTASVSGVAQSDGNPDNDTGSVDISVGGVDLRLVKSVSNPTANEDDTITYTLIISNESANDASGISVTDTLPAGIMFNALVSPSLGNATTPATGAEASVVWELESLPAGDTASLGIETTIEVGTYGQTITNSASVASVDQIDANDANDASSVDLVVGGVPEEIPAEGKRKAFVGIVLGEPGASVDISKQGTGERITILLPKGEYELNPPGGARADGFVLGARVVIQARQVGENWVAIKILVKPRKPNLPITGVVLTVENGVVTITMPDGTIQTLELPEGFEDLTPGELITAFPGKSGQAKGVVKADKIRDRLQRFLDKLTNEEPEASAGAAGEDDEEKENRSKRAAKLIRVLEKHGERQIGIMDEVLDRVPEHAREKLERAKANVEKGRGRSSAAIQRAIDRFGDDLEDQTSGRPGKSNRGQGKPGDPEGEDTGTGSVNPGQGQGRGNSGSNDASGNGGGKDNDRGNSGGGKDNDRGNSGGKGKK